MTVSETNQEQSATPEKPDFDWNQFFQSPEVGKAITRAIEAWEKNLAAKSTITQGAYTKWVILTVSMFSILILSIAVLAGFHILSSEATGFLFGVIATGAIAIARDFFRSAK